MFKVYQMDDSVSGWMQLGDNIDGGVVYDYEGFSVSLSVNGNMVAISSPNNDNGDASGHMRFFVLEWWWMEGYLLAVVTS